MAWDVGSCVDSLLLERGCPGQLVVHCAKLGRKCQRVGTVESGTTPIASREGARAADCAAEKSTSRMALW